MKRYEEQIYREFPELIYVADLVWTRGDSTIGKKIFIDSQVDYISYEQVLPPELIEKLEIIEVDSYAPSLCSIPDPVANWLYSATHAVVNLAGRLLAVYSVRDKWIWTHVEAIPVMKSIIMGLFPNIIMKSVFGKALEITVNINKESVEEDMVEKLAEAKAAEIDLRYRTEIRKLKRKIYKLQDELKSKHNEIFLAAVKMQDKWKIEKDENAIYFKYKGEIIPDTIESKKGVFKIPEEQQNFYVRDLTVCVTSPHTYSVTANAFHPNVSPYDGTVCLGDLSGKPLYEIIEKLPEMLKTINLRSAYGGEAADLASEIIHGKEVSQVWEVIENDL